MFKVNIYSYLGKEENDYFSGIFAENNFFLCFEIFKTNLELDIYKIIEILRNKIKKLFLENNLINSLSEFDNFISSFIIENNFPAGFSLSCGYLKGDTFYLKTINEGEIYIKRKNKFGLIIKGDNTASGKIEENDLFILTTKKFLNLIFRKIKIEDYFLEKKPKEIIEEINLTLKNNNTSSLLLMEFLKEKEFVKERDILNKDFFKKINFFEKIKIYFLIMRNSKKTLTILIAFLLFVLLVWSATGAIKRKNIIAFDNKEKQVRELILQKIQMAEDVAFLNIDRAIILLKESNQEFENLKKEAERLKIKSKKINELQEIIKMAEEKIIKKEKANFEEFFDLVIDNKQALGNRVYLFNNIVYVLDKKNNIVYKLSLEKKSLEKIESRDINKVDLLVGDEKNLFVYIKGLGIYQNEDLGKLKKIIDNDKDWGDIIDIALYNGNLYLVDKDKDEIWKYLGAENGFSEKKSYFSKGEAIDLSLINSFSIDGSIYLGEEKNIYKYISGSREKFDFDLPSNDFNFNKIFTNTNLEKIYILDKKNSIIYILGKTGDYVEQVNSDIFSKADDFFVYKDKIYVLLKSKIYKILN